MKDKIFNKRTAIFVFTLLALAAPALALDTTRAVTLGVITTVVAGTSLAVMMAGVGPAAAMYLAATSLIGGAAIGATAYFSSQPSSDANKPYVSPAGDIAKPANVTWVDLSSGDPTVKTAPISAKVSTSDMQSTIPCPPATSKYPKLQAALYGPGGVVPVTKDSRPGDLVADSTQSTGFGTVMYNTGLSNSNYGGCYSPANGPNGNNTLNYNWNGYTVNKVGYNYCTGTVGYQFAIYTQAHSAPPPVPVDGPTAAKNLSNSASPPYAPAGVYSDFYGDIDNFIHDNPNVVHFDDGPASSVGSNPALTPPAGADASQVSNAVAAKSGQTASAAQGAAVGAAQGMFNAYSSAYGKSDPRTQQAAAALAAQQAAQAAQQAAQSSEAAKQNDAGAGNTPDAPKTLDLTPFNRLSGAMSSTFPFSLLGTISGYYSAFVAAPSPPVFDLPMPLGFTIHIDLTPWDVIAEIVRYTLAVLMTAGAVVYVVNFWRGVS